MKNLGQSFFLAILFLCAHLLVSPAAHAQKPIIAVFTLTAEGARLSKSSLERMTIYLSNQLTASGLYQVLPQDQLRKRLRQEKKSSYKACFDQSCQIAIGRELAANKSMATKVLRIGRQCIVTATIYDLRSSATESAAAHKGKCGEEGILKSMDAVLSKLSGGTAGELSGPAGGVAPPMVATNAAHGNGSAKWPPACARLSPAQCLKMAKAHKEPNVAFTLAAMGYAKARKSGKWQLVTKAERQMRTLVKGYIPHQSALESALKDACRRRRDNRACLAGAFLVTEDKRKAEATPLYQAACDRGSHAGCYGFARANYDGKGVSQNKTRANALYRRACDGGDLKACTTLGLNYRYGYGVAKNPTKGIALYRRACDGRYISACASLASAYQSGSGIPKNPLKGANILRKACDSGHMSSCSSLAYAYKMGNGLIKSMVKATALYRRACDGGYYWSCNYLADAHRLGDGVVRSDVKAMALYRRACEGGISSSCKKTANDCPYGYLRSGGICVKKSTSTASCGTGYYKNKYGRCVKKPSCGSGYYFSYVTKACKKLSSSKCGLGYYKNKYGRCIKKPNCGTGYYFSYLTKRCKKSSSSNKCGTGYYKNKYGRCVKKPYCGTGYYFSYLTKRCKKLSSSNKCGIGYYKNKYGRCLKKPKCGTGYYFSYLSKTCKRSSSYKKCSTGYYYSNSKKRCTSICRSGYYWSTINKKCKKLR
jgi:TPR repeat protein